MDVVKAINPEKEKQLRLQLLLDKLVEILRERFHKHFPVDPAQLYNALFLKKKTLETLKKHGRLRKEQYLLILPLSGRTESKKFDITILAILLLELCNIVDETEREKFRQARYARNEVQHLTSADTTKDVDALLETVKKAISDLGCCQKDIDEMMKVVIDNKAFKQINTIEKSREEFSFQFLPPVANFIGREKEIEEIHQHLDLISSEGNKYGVVVCGMTGVGKTEIVRQYWKTYSNTYYDGRIIWINAQTKSSIEVDFIGIAEQAGLPIIDPNTNHQKPINQIVDMTYWHFAKRNSGQPQRKILFVFDNAVTMKDLKPFLPTFNKAPFMLITSQRKDWDRQHFDIYPVDVLSEELANQFLVNNLDIIQRKDESFNTELITLLEFHPLAMQQAVSYISMSNINVQDYVELLKEADWSKLSDQVQNNQLETKSVFKTFSLCVKNLTADKDLAIALHLLKTIAYLDGKRIEKETLKQLCSGDVLATNKAIIQLHNYSLIHQPSYQDSITSGNIVTMHSLVKLTILSINKIENITSRFVNPLLDMIFNQLAKEKVQDHEAKALQQLIYLYDQKETQHQLLLKYIGMMNNANFGEIFYSRGQLTKWMEILTSVKKIVETDMQGIYSGTHVPTKDAVETNELLMCERHQKFFKQAKLDGVDNWCNANQENTPLDIQRDMNLFIARYSSDLNVVIMCDGCDKKIKGRQYRCLNCVDMNLCNTCYRRGTKPKDHSEQHDVICLRFICDNCNSFIVETRIHCNKCPDFDLCLGCYKSKQYPECHNKTHSVIKSHTVIKSHLIPGDENLLNGVFGDIALCLCHLGKHEEALKLYYKVEKAYSTSLHIDHPSVLTTQHNIARCLTDLGKYEEALQLYYKVEKTELTLCNIDLPSLLTTQHDIARCLARLGKYEEALELYYKVEKAYLTSLHIDHPSVLATQHNIALCLTRLGKYEEALELYYKVEKAQLTSLHIDHPSVLVTQHNIAQCLYHLGKCQEALELYYKVEKAQITSLHIDHPSVLTTQHDIARCLACLGKYEQAFKLYCKVEKAELTSLHIDHPSVLMTQNNIAQCFYHLGKYEEALELYYKVKKAQLTSLHIDHPSVLTTQHDIARSLARLGKYEESLCILYHVKSTLQSRQSATLYPVVIQSIRLIEDEKSMMSSWCIL